MRIAIDVTPLSSGHRDRGIGVYTRNIIDALKTYETDHTYILFSPREGIPSQADLVFYPYFDHFFSTLPANNPKPAVVLVYDMIPILFPEHFKPGIRGKIRWIMQRRSLRRARRIIAISKSTKTDIENLTGVPGTRIDAVYLAPDPVFRPEKKSPGAVLDKHGIAGEFILYVGDVNWNKNVTGLIRAFHLLRQRKGSFPHKLVLVGKAFRDILLPETVEIRRLVNILGLANDVVTTGFIPADELNTLYNAAEFTVQPSHYEGFGFPVVEAMSSGCPVVATDVSSLREITGPSLRALTPSYTDLSAAMGEMLAMTKEEKEARIRKGFEWVKQFTWKRTARETVRAYEKAVE